MMRLSNRIFLYLVVLATTLSCSQDAELDDYAPSSREVIQFANHSANSRAMGGMPTHETEVDTQSFDGGSMAVMVSDIPVPQAVPTATRGASLTTATLTDCGVVAYQSDNMGFASAYPASPTLLMDHQRVNCSYNAASLSSTCTYSPIQYWPIGKYLNFYAYAPYTTPNNTTGGLTETPNNNGLSYTYTVSDGPQITYAMPTTATRQIDLLCATPQLDKYTQSAKLNLDFKHQLAMVGFRVSGVGYTLKDLLITGIENEGTLKLEDMSWSYKTTNTATIYRPGFNFVTSTGLALSSTPQLIQNEDGYLMTIPQQFTANAKLRITYIYSGSSITKTLDLSTVTTQWEAGKKYIYDISLGERGIWYRIDSDSDDDWVLWDTDNQLSSTSTPRALSTLDIRTDNGFTISNARLVVINNYLTSCTNLIDVDMSLATNSVTTLESRFQAQVNLKSMALPKNITAIGNNCFYNCYYIEKITGTENVISIGARGFQTCKALKEVSDLSKVVTIGNYAFQDCSTLEYISDFPALITLGQEAFRSCSSLKNYPIMPSLTTWSGIMTFSDCTSISGSITVYSNGVTALPDRTFSGCQSIDHITFNEGFTTLGNHIIRNASNGAYGSAHSTYALKTITLPSTLTSIGTNAFQDCYSVTDIYCYATTPPACVENTFTNLGANIANSEKFLHVPASAVEEYKKTDPWKKLINVGKYTLVGDLPEP